MSDDVTTRIIPREHFIGVCRPGQGSATCRYIVGGAAGIECAKHVSFLASQIDARVRAGTFVARGDNCPGL